MSEFSINIATVREVENEFSKDASDGLRVRAELTQDNAKNINDIPWAFPILPKTFRSTPKVGEAVFLFINDMGGDKTTSQRYYLGPIVSQDQYNDYSEKKKATSLLDSAELNPIVKLSNYAVTHGSFPKQGDIAVVGRGQEDIILRSDEGDSEVDIRAGIRFKPTNSEDPNLFGNVIFNGIDPAYIQLKRKAGMASKGDNSANSLINMVANRINIMSNLDDTIAHNLGDQQTLVKYEKMDEIMDNLHQVPMGDKLVELLELIVGAIMHHVHPWAGMEQCGDWPGYIKKLETFDIKSILSKYVRIS